MTVGVILAGGYLMSYLVKLEEENVQKTLGAKGLKVRLYFFHDFGKEEREFYGYII